jgi:hypothetical protein
MREPFSLFQTLGTVAKERPDSSDAAALAEEIAAHVWRSVYVRANEHLEAIARDAESCVYSLRASERSVTETRTWYAGQMYALGTIARLALEAVLPFNVNAALQEHPNLTRLLQMLGSSERSIAALAQELRVDPSQLEKEFDVLARLNLVQVARDDSPEVWARLTSFGHEALHAIGTSQSLDNGASEIAGTANSLAVSSESSLTQFPVEYYDDSLWRLGWTDGGLGVEPPRDLIEAEATRTRYERLNEARLAVNAASATERIAEQVFANVREDWERARFERDNLADERRRNPASFSPLLGRFYGIVAVLILIADLPLALLVSQTLSFRAPTEAFAVTLGVAGLTIAFKLVIDAFASPHHSPTRSAGLGRTVLLSLVAGGTIVVLVLIGFIRAAGPQASPTLSAATFTVMAILFPVVAAFCLSIFHLTHQNTVRMKAVAAAHEQLEANWMAAMRALEQAKAASEEARAKYAEISEDENYANFSKALYRHGYERGYAQQRVRRMTEVNSPDAPFQLATRNS